MTGTADPSHPHNTSSILIGPRSVDPWTAKGGQTVYTRTHYPAFPKNDRPLATAPYRRVLATGTVSFPTPKRGGFPTRSPLRSGTDSCLSRGARGDHRPSRQAVLAANI